MSGPTIAAEGVTNPSIDDLLTCEDIDPAELAAEEAAAQAAAAARQQARGAEDLAAAIEEIASLADELQLAEA